MTFYGSLATTVTGLLTDKGRQMTLLRRVPGTFNPVTGVSAGGTLDSVTVTGVVGTFSRQQIDGTRVLMTDRRVTLTPSAAPLCSDALEIDGVAHQIVSIIEVKPATTTLAYVVQARAV